MFASLAIGALMKAAASWLGSIVSPVTNFFTSFFQTKFNVDLGKYQASVGGDVALNTALINLEAQTQANLAMMAQADRGSLLTCWMKPAVFTAAFVPFAYWELDKTPLWGHVIHSWGVEAPSTMDWTIMLGVCGLVAVKGVTRIFSTGK